MDITGLENKLSTMKKEFSTEIKELILRADSDKNAIINKFEEMDKKIDGKFDKLNELIIDLFKNLK